jgi:hypothetical protein
MSSSRVELFCLSEPKSAVQAMVPLMWRNLLVLYLLADAWILVRFPGVGKLAFFKASGVGSVVFIFIPVIFVLPLVALILLVSLIRRRRRARALVKSGVTPAPVKTSTVQPPRSKTGILVIPAIEHDAQITKELSTWALRHPQDASLAVAVYDATGNVTGRIYETTGERKLLWNDAVGNVSAPEGEYGSERFHSQIEPSVRQLISNLLDPRAPHQA